MYIHVYLYIMWWFNALAAKFENCISTDRRADQATKTQRKKNNIYIYICIHICMIVCTYTYIYIYREREIDNINTHPFG